MKFRKDIFLSVAAAIAGVVSSHLAAADDFQVTDTWVMQISPAVRVLPGAATSAPAIPPVPSENGTAPAASSARSVDPADYARIYQSIPFNRAEYNANPNYRHDSAMEILTGNARHQTIVKHSNERPVVYDQPRMHAIPYRYNNPNWGLNYYFYFPYWNARGFY